MQDEKGFKISCVIGGFGEEKRCTSHQDKSLTHLFKSLT